MNGEGGYNMEAIKGGNTHTTLRAKIFSSLKMAVQQLPSSGARFNSLFPHVLPSIKKRVSLHARFVHDVSIARGQRACRM